MNEGMELRFRRLTAICTEDYLIRYANKGLYNRALKEIEKGATAQYAFEADEVTCTLGDGTVCTLTDSIERFACTCPSDKICKHVLIAILYYARQAGGAETESHPEDEAKPGPADSSIAESGSETGTGAKNETSGEADRAGSDGLPKPDFGWLSERPIRELVAPFAASKVEEAAFRLRYREELTVSEGSLLVVRMNRSGVEVAFTDAADVSRALCAVPGADGEMYKLEALLRYRASLGLRDEDALAGQLSPVSAPPELLREFRGSIEALLGGGLARLPRSFAARFELLAIAARSGGLPNLEREARGIHGELESFFARHVRFSVRALLGRLSRAALMIEALERDIGPARKAQLAGRFRSRYYTVPRLDLYGLGAEPWETRSGYRGITYYFCCAEDGGVYTYTQARPAYYEGAEFDYARHYRERTPWKPDLTLRTAGASMLSMRSAKVSDEGRLSSGGSPAVTVPERPPVEAFDFGSLLVGSFAELDAAGGEIRLFGGRPRRLALIRAAAIESCRYDSGDQALKLLAVDAAGERLEFIVPYHADWSTAITRLESGRGLPGDGEFYVFASVEPSGVYPISFLQGNGQVSLKLDL
ncbi:hypothetical protein CDO73_22625 [Saccharibacillus sp. O23]|uniref:hypothetical protein n=1 Tax=Saccharibacillus sp. O23 TaxID=2009338 RepID=UPI000B4E456F|nr:hypothetical protein [Saccharibacillus sp. O23]OWR27415.1 hypothetical protein CDO73_22625 [Saccharibacillus sp. O23]